MSTTSALHQEHNPNSIEVFFWATPNGHKITIAAEELGLPYVIRPIDIGAGVQFNPEFLKVNPNSKIPAIRDPQGLGDGQPLTVFESGAILQYLARKAGNKLYGADERSRAKVDEWLFWQVGGIGPIFGNFNHFVRYAPKMVDDVSKLTYGRERFSKETDRLLGVLDKQLQDHPYVAGNDFTIADVAIWPWMQVLPGVEKPLAGYANVAAWVERVRARPAVQRALAVGKEHVHDVAKLSPEQQASLLKTLFGAKPAA